MDFRGFANVAADDEACVRCYGGGDAKLVEALYDMMEGNAGLETSLEASVESHLMGIKAEESRLAEGKLLLVHN